MLWCRLVARRRGKSKSRFTPPNDTQAKCCLRPGSLRSLSVPPSTGLAACFFYKTLPTNQGHAISSFTTPEAPAGDLSVADSILLNERAPYTYTLHPTPLRHRTTRSEARAELRTRLRNGPNGEWRMGMGAKKSDGISLLYYLDRDLASGARAAAEKAQEPQDKEQFTERGRRCSW